MLLEQILDTELLNFCTEIRKLRKTFDV